MHETFSVVVLFVAGSLFAMAAQEPAKTIQTVEAKPTATMNGEEMFKEYCAVCHGGDARGGGPAAEALQKRPADLTQLSRKNSGKFPKLQVMNYIKGQDVVAAHGSRAMPIWGSIFHQMSANKDLVQIRVNNLLRYLEKIQAE